MELELPLTDGYDELVLPGTFGFKTIKITPQEDEPRQTSLLDQGVQDELTDLEGSPVFSVPETPTKETVKAVLESIKQ